jgi:hypothetical protein
MMYNEAATYCKMGSRWLTGYAGAALIRAGEHADGDDPGRIHGAEEGARDLASWWSPSATTRADADGGRQAISTERRAS